MKNILVTGASKGLGLEISKAILQNADDTIVYGVNRSNTDEFKALAGEFENRVHFKSFDLSNVEQIKSMLFKEFISIQTPLHGFVNNAAFAYDDIVTNLNYEKLADMYKVNVFAPLMITKNVIRNMIFHRSKGSIVHISSISVHTGYKGLSMYASTKGALEAFSKNTAREWGSTGIRSNSLVAGFMETEMSASLDSKQKSRIYKRTSLKKATEKTSVANTAAFLLSEKAGSITGQNIHVDSGTI